jgi:hypothetical protein
LSQRIEEEKGMGSLMDEFNKEFVDKGRRRPGDVAVSVVVTCVVFYELVKLMPVNGFSVFDLIVSTAVVYYNANLFTALLHDVALYIRKRALNRLA